MTPAEIERLKDSARELARRHDEFSRLFHEHLFVACPDLRPMFQGGVGNPREVLARSIDAIVASAEQGAEQGGSQRDEMRAMAGRHTGYGARPEHFAPFRNAFLWALAQLLADRFTPDLRQAWTTALDDVTRRMLADMAEKG